MVHGNVDSRCHQCCTSVIRFCVGSEVISTLQGVIGTKKHHDAVMTVTHKSDIIHLTHDTNIALILISLICLQKHNSILINDITHKVRNDAVHDYNIWTVALSFPQVISHSQKYNYIYGKKHLEIGMFQQ